MVGAKRTPLVQYEIWEIFECFTQKSASNVAGYCVTYRTRFGDILADWAKRRVRRAFGVVTVNESVGSVVRLSIVTRPAGCLK